MTRLFFSGFLVNLCRRRQRITLGFHYRRRNHRGRSQFTLRRSFVFILLHGLICGAGLVCFLLFVVLEQSLNEVGLVAGGGQAKVNEILFQVYDPQQSEVLHGRDLVRHSGW